MLTMSSSVNDTSDTLEVKGDVDQNLDRDVCDYNEENSSSLSMKRKYYTSPIKKFSEIRFESKDESSDNGEPFPSSTVKKVRFNVPSDSQELISCNSSQNIVQNESFNELYSSSSSLNAAVINNQLLLLVQTDSTSSSTEESKESSSYVNSQESDVIDDVASLSDYPHFDEFPDLGNDDDDDFENDCCPCDFSDRLGPSTSEPDVIIYSERTSDAVTDCYYICAPPGRATGFSILDVED